MNHKLLKLSKKGILHTRHMLAHCQELFGGLRASLLWSCHLVSLEERELTPNILFLHIFQLVQDGSGIANLSAWSSDSVLALLRYLYGGLTNIEDRLLASTLDLAERYKFMKLLLPINVFLS